MVSLQCELDHSKQDFSAIAEWIDKNSTVENDGMRRNSGDSSAQTYTDLYKTSTDRRETDVINAEKPDEFYYKRVSCKYQQINTPPPYRKTQSPKDQTRVELSSPYDNQGFVNDEQRLTVLTVQENCVVHMPNEKH